MKKIYIVTLLFVFGFSVSHSQKDSVFVCDVKFKNSKFDNSHAGSGFLLKYNGKVYGITAKHVLFFAKTDRMKTISFGEDLVSWNFKSKNSDLSIKAGKLLNENPNEELKMPPKGDWLIFEIVGSVPKNAVVYSLRTEPLHKGDNVRFLGYPYNSKKLITISGQYIGQTKDNNLRLDVPKGTYNGCSGGPVIDAKGNIVGIVSMGYFNKSEGKMIFEPASIEYFKQIIAQNQQ